MPFVHRFARASHSYALHSQLQQSVAYWLAQHMPTLNANARILEVGCGTGHLTQLLTAQYPYAQYVASDGIAAMAATQTNTIFYDITAEPPAAVTQHAPYDCIVGNLVLHWCDNPLQTVQQLMRLLSPNGCMLFTAPTPYSTMAWQHLIQRPLPCLTVEALLPFCVLQHEYHIPLHTTTAEYVQFLRATGTTGQHRERLLPTSYVRALSRSKTALHDVFVAGLYQSQPTHEKYC